tara:strand:+ start:2199 stop:2549 length:351 start_codon:yes stop_codon:yes gene_type:complete
MTVYSASAEAAKQAVLQGLTDDLSVDTLQKLWDHYLGLRSIAETQKESIPLFTNSAYPEYIGGIGDDHISFDLGGESPCIVPDTSDINLDNLTVGNDFITFGNTDTAVANGELPKE